MRNYTWVCFNCRAALRRESNSSVVSCPSCGEPCASIGEETPIPSKSKVREWEALRSSFDRWTREALASQKQHRARRIHGLEKEISGLEALSPTADRSQAIQALKERLKAERDQ
jgi:hypothetical protein